MRSLNATPSYLYSNTWGYWDPATNRYTGMFGDLFYKRAYIGGTAGFIVPDRVILYEFVTMMTPMVGGFMFRPPPLSNVANIYYLPFQSTVWIGSGTIVLVSCLIIYNTIRLNNRDKVTDAEEKTTRVSDVALVGIGAVCQMGTSLNTRHLSSKISSVSLWIVCNIIYESPHT